MKKRVSLETAIMLVDNGIFIKSDRIYLKGLLEDNITFNPLVNYEYYYAPTHEELVESYDLISVEDLNVKGMIKNHKLSKHIADASWGNFVNLLQYKCDWYGRKLVKINRFFPSSKTCGDCGWINQNLKLSDREWTCKSCSVVHDRDINASRNILKEGLKIYRQGLSITKVEDKSDYLGSTSVETRSPSHRFSVGG